jgi:very-short-patch-repair endonuclease
VRELEQTSQKYAKALRRRMTDAETILWSSIRRSAVNGMHFRRQHPIGPYVADFACALARVVIEVDGATHSSNEEQEYDRRRDSYMQSRGWRIIRVTNTEIYKSLNDVLDGLFRLPQETADHGAPAAPFDRLRRPLPP